MPHPSVIANEEVVTMRLHLLTVPDTVSAVPTGNL
jgi:hypothetical protein